ncbi:MAG: hypothetical protein ACR2QF_04975 [Geminicoccaceae bacterium]
MAYKRSGSPFVDGMIIGGIAVLVAFALWIKRRREARAALFGSIEIFYNRQQQSGLVV